MAVDARNRGAPKVTSNADKKNNNSVRTEDTKVCRIKDCKTDRTAKGVYCKKHYDMLCDGKTSMRKDGIEKSFKGVKRKRDGVAAFTVVLNDGQELSSTFSDEQLEILQATLGGAKFKKEALKKKKVSIMDRLGNLREVVGEQ